MDVEKIEVRCPFLEFVREYFPIIPFVVPLVPVLLLIACLWMYLHRISGSLERQEELLEEILTAVRRLS